MVFLWTDLCLFALLLGGGVWLGFALRREYWRVALRQVIANRVAMISFGVLCVYLAVALLDSIHFREAVPGGGKGTGKGPVISLLDQLCGGLRTNVEKSYSQPFAVRAFVKETVTRPDGTQERAYKYLKHGGSHLANDSDGSAPRWVHRAADIAGRVAAGLGFGLLIGLAYFAVAVGLWYAASRWQWQDAEARRVLGRRALWVAGFLTAVTVGLTLIVQLVAGEPVATTAGAAVEVRGGYHILGTNKTGTDVFYISLKSVRTGLIIGSLTTLIVTPFAILLGILAGYLGGWVDDLITYVYSTLESIPSILLITAGMLVFQFGAGKEEMIFSSDKRLLYLCCVLGTISWVGLCRLIRGEVLKLREVEYVQAAEAFGVQRLGIMFRHLAPNVMHIVLITVVLRFSGLVLAEAVLAYIGIGVDPSMNSWGNMINGARLELARDPVVWWQLLAAFVFMFGLVLPANLFGDAVRDALDPRLRTQ